MLARLLPITFLLGLLLAVPSQAATIKLPVPAEGEVAVAVAAVPKGKKLSLRVTKAPAAVAVSGSAKRGRLAIAVTRPHGTFGSGSVSVKLRGGKAKGVRRIGAALGGGSAPRAACKTLGRLLAKPLQAGTVAAGDLRTVGAAVGARLCGKPEPGGAAAVLARLGLGGAGGGGGLNPGGGGNPPAPPLPSGPINQCANGVDDDKDGQVDAASERKLRPDPGCMNANDSTETGEVPVAAACAAISGASIGDEPNQLEVGINAGCGSFVELSVYAAPNAFVCDIQASAGAWTCVIAHGQPYAETRNATAADQADLQIGLNGPVNCAVPATIVLYRPDFTVSELVAPVGGCGAAEPACANGLDDDGDGLADAHDAAGAANPDPGCSGPADTTEDSEVALPAGCAVELSIFNDDPRFVGIAAHGCGTIKGAWFKPSAAPSDCFYAIGDGAVTGCDVSGATAGATFAPTTAEVLLAMHTVGDPACAPVTAAITLGNGSVAKYRDDWC